MTQDEFGYPQHKLTFIREGMMVYDETGEEVGRVGMVFLGTVLGEEGRESPGDTVDPVRPDVTSLTDTPGEDTYTNPVGEFFGSDENLPEPLRGPAMNEGFIRIDREEPSAPAYYATPEQVASVSEENVELHVSRDELMRARG